MKINEITWKFEKAISRGRMELLIRELSIYERYPASEGYRAAAERCVAHLKDTDINSEIISFPCSHKTFYQVIQGRNKWVCHDAWVELEEDGGRRICDYKANCFSVWENSGPCKHTKTPVELIVLNRGTDESAYEDIDFSGKVAYLPRDTSFWACKWLSQRSILAIICCSEAGSNMDEVLPWRGIDLDDQYTFSVFGVSVQEDKRLRNFFRSLSKEGKVPHVRLLCDTETSEGSYDLVNAFIPGETDEEIVCLAHLCHPQGSCNDNLSGCVAGMELMRATKRLLERGDLPPLKRGLRLLLVPELKGAPAYLESIGLQKRKKILAGINLDMVGASQNNQNGPLLINEPPHACPSFVTALCQAILEELKEEERITGRYGFVPLFNSHIMEYRGGSDHAFFTDPICGIPMPMVGQEPDRFYHTSGDRPETLDMYILSRSATLAGAYMFTLANLCENNVREITPYIAERMMNRIHFVGKKVRLGDIAMTQFGRQAGEHYRFYSDMCDDFLRFFTGKELEKVKQLIDTEKKQLHILASMAAERIAGKPVDFCLDKPRLSGGDWDLIPRRNYFGNSQDLDAYAKYVCDEAGKKAHEVYDKGERMHMWSHSEYQCEYFVDGKRTLGEIVERTRLEIYEKCTDESLKSFILTQAAMGLISFVDVEEKSNV
jgi:hypothetical protein